MDFQTDVAIVTIIPPEYEAVKERLTDLQTPEADEFTNLHSWVLGSIPAAVRQGSYRVVLALAGRQGGSSATATTIETIRRWRPRAVLLVGIAGGFRHHNLEKGDVVVSSLIIGYEYGKLTETFTPRPDLVFQTGRALLNSASTVTGNWDTSDLPQRPVPGPGPKVVFGHVASGEKLVDSFDNTFFRSVLQAYPKVLCVEMEGAGAASAIQYLDDLDMRIGLLMIRGISDLPLDTGAEADAALQTDERDAWKAYAAASAASFSLHFIANNWPYPTTSKSGTTRTWIATPSSESRRYASGDLSPKQRLVAEIRHRRIVGDPFILLLGRSCELETPGDTHPAGAGFSTLSRLVREGWFNVVLTHQQGPRLHSDLSRYPEDNHIAAYMALEDRSALKLVHVLGISEPRIKIIELSGLSIQSCESRRARVLRHLGKNGLLIVDYGAGDTPLEAIVEETGASVWIIGAADDAFAPDSEMLRSRRSQANWIDREGLAGQAFLQEIAEIANIHEIDAQRGVTLIAGTEQNSRAGRLRMLQGRLEEAVQKDDLGAITALRTAIDRLSFEGEGTILGEYKVEVKIGTGSTGTVFAARHLLSSTSAAIKILNRAQNQDYTTVYRFFRGARLLRIMNHPNIVRVYEPGCISGTWYYYVMELVDGPNLEVLLDSNFLDSQQLWTIARQILEAMSYAHHFAEDVSIVHRDLKPANILVTEDITVKLTDFDTAFFDRENELSFGTSLPMGTAFYIAPEMENSPTIESQRDPAIDVFALGRLLLRMFAKIPARESFVTAYLQDEEGLRLALTSHVPGRVANVLCRLITKATAKDPADRYADAREMREAFVHADELRRSARSVPLSQLDDDFVLVSAGTFMRNDDGVEYPVTITSDFLMMKAPVTLGLWRTVWGEPSSADDRVAIEHISWYAAVGVCNALSDHFGLECCYDISGDGVRWIRSKSGFRLPTEAEWELACVAGLKRLDQPLSEHELDKIAWYRANTANGPMEVRLKNPNASGLYDMLGNVWEWCWDRFGQRPSEPQIDPAGPDDGQMRVLKGGSWRRTADFCCCAGRYDGDPRNGGRSLGFRVVRSA